MKDGLHPSLDGGHPALARCLERHLEALMALPPL
jgi:hypothetical protein